MLRIAIADIHCSEYQNDELNIESNLPRRLHEIINTLNKICKFAKTNNIENIDILGDIHHDKNIISTDAQNAFKGVLANNKHITFNIIAGNHDLSSTGDTQTSTIEVFDEYDNANIYTGSHKIEDNITILPYSNKITEEFRSLESNTILLSHFGVSEAMLQSGIHVASSISMKDLTKFKLVLLGHYHKPQELNREGTVLYYPGSIIHHNWNDKNEVKRFLVYDTETLEVQSIPITGITMYKEYTIDDESNSNDILTQVTADKDSGHIVRVKRNVKETENDTNTLFEDQGIHVIDKVEVDISQRGINTDMSDDDKLKRYLEIEEVSNPEEYLNDIKCVLSNEDISVDVGKYKLENIDENVDENVNVACVNIQDNKLNDIITEDVSHIESNSLDNDTFDVSYLNLEI